MAVQQNTDEIYHILEDEICSLLGIRKTVFEK